MVGTGESPVGGARGGERGKPGDVHYNRIKDDLIHGAYPPGSVLLETVLGERYGVSRTPVREALGRLAQDGFIERSARGFLVRRRSPEEILSIYEARISLESTAAALAAERRTSFDLSRLEHLAASRRDVADPALRTRLNEDWHRALRDASRNDIIVGFLDRLDSLLAMYRPARRGRDGADPTVDEHGAILDAVRGGDATRAREAMTVHLTRMRDLRIEGLAQGHG
ncbi:GntR family transcriptional regulator [Streptomyces radicis]|uniref:GntR family transcriptional regulator n=1 Tax=Streptomyces radicis TaxID=1750517 RepID=A0A3A9X1Z2_9ACTN|nr:GntR family transcriptional regulator [Streptomyces radicis]RKN12517.1 GntR family transcriptional regulator [Streptomyces radicis]RKN27717.1 GntR family transcriptional regulator [Streptomyces radicis]